MVFPSFFLAAFFLLFFVAPTNECLSIFFRSVHKRGNQNKYLCLKKKSKCEANFFMFVLFSPHFGTKPHTHHHFLFPLHGPSLPSPPFPPLFSSTATLLLLLLLVLLLLFLLLPQPLLDPPSHSTADTLSTGVAGTNVDSVVSCLSSAGDDGRYSRSSSWKGLMVDTSMP